MSIPTSSFQRGRCTSRPMGREAIPTPTFPHPTSCRTRMLPFSRIGLGEWESLRSFSMQPRSRTIGPCSPTDESRRGKGSNRFWSRQPRRPTSLSRGQSHEFRLNPGSEDFLCSRWSFCAGMRCCAKPPKGEVKGGAPARYNLNTSRFSVRGSAPQSGWISLKTRTGAPPARTARWRRQGAATGRRPRSRHPWRCGSRDPAAA